MHQTMQSARNPSLGRRQQLTFLHAHSCSEHRPGGLVGGAAHWGMTQSERAQPQSGKNARILTNNIWA